MSELERIHTPAFLLWLQQFVGQWENGDEVFEIRRRRDGLLKGHTLSPYESVSLAGIIEQAQQTSHYDLRSLGPRPAVLSAQLMKLWLTPEQYENLREAWRVGSGMRRIIETIEQNMRDLPAEECKARWLDRWRHGQEDASPLSTEDRQTHEVLFQRFRQEENM